MKNNCVLCYAPLQIKSERYIEYGNYCPTCVRDCNALERIYYGNEPVKDEKESNKDFSFRVEQWLREKKHYKEETERFQKHLRSQRESFKKTGAYNPKNIYVDNLVPTNTYISSIMNLWN